jgi:hypoxanthine phosphoribosyltransferase
MEVLIEEYKIDRRVRALAHKITEEHKNSGNDLPPVMICVLNGAFPFFSDLMKDMGVDCEVDFIRAKSYNGKDNSGGVEITKDLEIELRGKRVYIVEDMVDTGQTMFEILCRVNDKMPNEIKIVTLVHRKGNTFPVDHYCFEVGDEWLVGYGFDDNGLKRNYRNIYKK